MRTQTYTTRRGNTMNTSWSRNRNTVRHASRELGPITQFLGVGILVLILGLFFVAQGTQVTSYDYELSAIEDEIAELEAKKEDLAVEKARLTSVAATENTAVANNMETASAAGYAAE